MAVAWVLYRNTRGSLWECEVAIKLLSWGGAEKVMKEESERLENVGK